ncbi:hypothetical protein [Microcoleus sp. herbarium14]|uniref:hypothetical protein n=2 Tax=Microcoleus TaxID=44471 RepID=UPI002FD215E2
MRAKWLNNTHFTNSQLICFLINLTAGAIYMSLNDNIAQTFKDLANLGNTMEREQLKKQVKGYSIKGWKEERIAMVVASGGISGALGGPMGLAAIPADLAWCGRVSALGCFGIGHIKGIDVDYDVDMNLIMSIWTGLGEAASTIPVGKVGIKVCSKATPKIAAKVAGVLVSKVALKGGSKLGAKLASKAASKAAAKLATKLMAKTGTGWIPLVGGIVSGGVNWWLVDGLLEAAEQYYSHEYIVLRDGELASAA